MQSGDNKAVYKAALRLPAAAQEPVSAAAAQEPVSAAPEESVGVDFGDLPPVPPARRPSTSARTAILSAPTVSLRRQSTAAFSRRATADLTGASARTARTQTGPPLFTPPSDFLSSPEGDRSPGEHLKRYQRTRHSGTSLGFGSPLQRKRAQSEPHVRHAPPPGSPPSHHLPPAAAPAGRPSPQRRRQSARPLRAAPPPGGQGSPGSPGDAERQQGSGAAAPSAAQILLSQLNASAAPPARHTPSPPPAPAPAAAPTVPLEPSPPSCRSPPQGPAPEPSQDPRPREAPRPPLAPSSPANFHEAAQCDSALPNGLLEWSPPLAAAAEQPKASHGVSPLFRSAPLTSSGGADQGAPSAPGHATPPHAKLVVPDLCASVGSKMAISFSLGSMMNASGATTLGSIMNASGVTQPGEPDPMPQVRQLCRGEAPVSVAGLTARGGRPGPLRTVTAQVSMTEFALLTDPGGDEIVRMPLMDVSIDNPSSCSGFDSSDQVVIGRLGGEDQYRIASSASGAVCRLLLVLTLRQHAHNIRAEQRSPWSPLRAKSARRLSIVHYNDVYHLDRVKLDEPCGGAARFLHQLDEIRGRCNPLVLFSGDFVGPSLMSVITRGKQMVDGINFIGTRAGCWGNHEFDYGAKNLERIIAGYTFGDHIHPGSQADWVCTNLENKEGEPLCGASRSLLITWDGIKVGIIGLAENWLSGCPRLHRGEAYYRDMAETGEAAARQLQEQGAEVVIALTHNRLQNDKDLTAKAPSIDLLLGGHDHFYEHSLDHRIIKSGEEFQFLSEVTLTLPADREDPTGISTECRAHAITSDLPESSRMHRLVVQYDTKMQQRMGKAVCRCDSTLDSTEEACRFREGVLTNFLADVMQDYCRPRVDCAVLGGAAVSGKNALSPGTVTIGDVFSWFPFETKVQAVEMSGAVLQRMLDQSVMEVPQEAPSFPHPSRSLSFSLNASEWPPRCTDVTIDGQALDPDRSYRVAVTDFVAAGRERFSFLLTDARLLSDADSAEQLGQWVLQHMRYLMRQQNLAMEEDASSSSSSSTGEEWGRDEEEEEVEESEGSAPSHFSRGDSDASGACDMAADSGVWGDMMSPTVESPGQSFAMRAERSLSASLGRRRSQRARSSRHMGCLSPIGVGEEDLAEFSQIGRQRWRPLQFQQLGDCSGPQLSRVAAIAARVASEADHTAAVRSIAGAARELLGCSVVVAWRGDIVARALTLAACDPQGTEPAEVGPAPLWGEGPSGEAALVRRPIAHPNHFSAAALQKRATLPAADDIWTSPLRRAFTLDPSKASDIVQTVSGSGQPGSSELITPAMELLLSPGSGKDDATVSSSRSPMASPAGSGQPRGSPRNASGASPQAQPPIHSPRPYNTPGGGTAPSSARGRCGTSAARGSTARQLSCSTAGRPGLAVPAEESTDDDRPRGRDVVTISVPAEVEPRRLLLVLEARWALPATPPSYSTDVLEFLGRAAANATRTCLLRELQRVRHDALLGAVRTACTLALDSELELRGRIEHLTRAGRSLLGCELCLLFLVDTEASQLWAPLDDPEAGEPSTVRVPLRSGLIAQVAKNSKSFFVRDARVSGRNDEAIDRATGVSPGALLCVPVPAQGASGGGSGDTVGVLYFAHDKDKPARFDSRDDVLAQAWAAYCSASITQTEELDRLRRRDDDVALPLLSVPEVGRVRMTVKEGLVSILRPTPPYVSGLLLDTSLNVSTRSGGAQPGGLLPGTVGSILPTPELDHTNTSSSNVLQFSRHTSHPITTPTTAALLPWSTPQLREPQWLRQYREQQVQKSTAAGPDRPSSRQSGGPGYRLPRATRVLPARPSSAQGHHRVQPLLKQQASGGRNSSRKRGLTVHTSAPTKVATLHSVGSDMDLPSRECTGGTFNLNSDTLSRLNSVMSHPLNLDIGLNSTELSGTLPVGPPAKSGKKK
eukprot:TRINITY_DN875_c0_g1_i1.p1 TRINITY_DN875_c0_g1~~TRINITY_DN875_c0_g1_i1.p1  ORF type:complete len:1923 (+),score=397.48 TRINITY_DN875_c0_g1_i1:69-5837(+)